MHAILETPFLKKYPPGGPSENSAPFTEVQDRQTNEDDGNGFVNEDLCALCATVADEVAKDDFDWSSDMLDKSANPLGGTSTQLHTLPNTQISYVLKHNLQNR